uniref:Avr9/Cf-9 rapidly elicited protein 146 n=1 Tax=Brassica oleracea var. oleracea TaxID=109376 RepID=A0A0D3AD59_BRAOL
MEKNVPLSKKLWNIVRFVMYMLHKGISKQKLLADFNATLKRGKNLIFHNRRRVPASATTATAASLPRKEYEFSCSDTPNYSFPFNMASFKKKTHNNISLFTCSHAPPTLEDDTSTSRAVLELLSGGGNQETGGNTPALTALSPYLPGFGRSSPNTPALSVEALTALSPCLPAFGRSSPSVRPLRVTDSPFPIREDGDVANGHVDKAADEFIKKFYKNLNQQKKMIEFSPN